MLEVITDTSPIQYLHQVNLLELLPKFYAQIIMPQAVADELAQGLDQGINLPEPASLSWLYLRQVASSNLVTAIPNLGSGEREVLSLAITLPDSLVVLDDALARSYAHRLNVKMTGTLGVLLKAKQLGYIGAIAPILDQLNQLNFRLSPITRVAVLKLADEEC